MTADTRDALLIREAVNALKDRVFPKHECPAESAAVWNVALYEMEQYLSSALRTPRPESDARDVARMQAIAAHPGWLRYLSSGARKGKWAFHAPTTNYEYDVFDTPQAAIDAALTHSEAK